MDIAEKDVQNPYNVVCVTAPFDVTTGTSFQDSKISIEKGKGKGKGKKPGKIPPLRQTNIPVSFNSLNSALTAKFIKCPTNPIAPSTMFNLHSHLESEISQLVKLFEVQQKELLRNFNQQANLIVASIVHNFSSKEDIPQTPHGDSTNYKKLFANIEKFKKNTGICYPPSDI